MSRSINASVKQKADIALAPNSPGVDKREFQRTRINTRVTLGHFIRHGYTLRGHILFISIRKHKSCISRRCYVRLGRSVPAHFPARFLIRFCSDVSPHAKHKHRLPHGNLSTLKTFWAFHPSAQPTKHNQDSSWHFYTLKPFRPNETESDDPT